MGQRGGTSSTKAAARENPFVFKLPMDTVGGMSVAEIKSEMAKLPPREIVHLAAFARHLARRSEAGYPASLEAERDALEKGDRIVGSELRRLAGELDSAGLRTSTTTC